MTQLPTPLTTADYIQVVAIIISLIIGLVGFVISIISIKQQSKAMQDMAKPYLNVFVDVYAIKTDYRVYVFKNFGTTPAYIDNIEIIGALDDRNQKHKFQSLIGNMVAPGQSITSTIDSKFHGTATLTITYHDQHQKIYKDSFKLDADSFVSLSYIVPDTNNDNDTASAIRQSTAALIRDMK